MASTSERSIPDTYLHALGDVYEKSGHLHRIGFITVLLHRRWIPSEFREDTLAELYEKTGQPPPIKKLHR